MFQFFISCCIVVIAITWAVLPEILRREFPVPEDSQQSCGILITGVSTGIGFHAATELAKDYKVVYGSIRKEKDGEKFAKLENVVPIIMDVTDSGAIDDALEFISKDLEKRNIRLCGLVNNAGVSGSQLVEAVKIEDVRWMFEVNFFGVFELTQKFLPLIRQAQGRIVNIGSLAGVIVRPFSAPYSSTKFALEAFTDGLRRELFHQNVSVSIVEPGVVASSMQVKASEVVPKIEKELESRNLMKVYKEMFVAKKKSSRNYQPENVWTPDASTTPAIKHALQDAFPRSRYAVAGFGPLPGKAIVLLASFLPDNVADFILMKL